MTKFVHTYQINKQQLMIQKIVFTLFFLTWAASTIAQIPLRYEQNESPTYSQTIEAYRYLDSMYAKAKLFTCGLSDSGHPLHLLVISVDEDFDPVSIKKKNKCTILINNGTHPGEPDGIDASIQLAIDILENKNKLQKYVQNTVICIVPVYNIGGQLNRSPYFRSNQNGPKEYGFRGNDKNYNLNRDFVKADALETRSLIEIFHRWQPEVFIDTHTSNGADYQYVMTLIATHHNLLDGGLKTFYKDKMLPHLYADMEKVGYPMIPYVNVWGTSPDNGFEGFMDTPRFASGYTSTFNTIAFVTETHMFKPYNQRVKSTYEFCLATLKFVSDNATELRKHKKEADAKTINNSEFVLQWRMDTVEHETLMFKGYEVKTKKSELTGQTRYYYDRNLPYEKPIPYYNIFHAQLSVKVPALYIIPQQWREVVHLLKISNIEMKRLAADTVLNVDAQYISDFENTDETYEGHYYHQNVQYTTQNCDVRFYKGDYVINPHQKGLKYLMQTLELDGGDSFFAWNFFDPILEQKEYFSPYVFEEVAIELLAKDAKLKQEFEHRKQNDAAFAKSAYAQLSFIYHHSVYYEPTHNRYPVFRFEAPMNLRVD